MEFSNPFDNPHGLFAILQNENGQYSLWPAQCAQPVGWRQVCEPQSQEACQQWLSENWQTLLPSYFAGENA